MNTQSLLHSPRFVPATGHGRSALEADAAADTGAASLERLGRLIQRMWLYPAEIAVSHPAYGTVVNRMIADAPDAAFKAALLGVVCHVNRRDYLQALSALRAIAA